MAHPDQPDAKALQIRKPDADWPSGAVWNFPASADGSLRLRIKFQPGHGGVLIGLTDHFSTPFDDQDELYNLYNLKIDAQGRIGSGGVLTAGKWHDLELAWNTNAQECLVRVDGRQVGLIRQSRISGRVNYLRLHPTAIYTDAAGFLIESVSEQGASGSAAQASAQHKAAGARHETIAQEGSGK